MQIELKFQYKYRLILDESFSFGTVGRTGRGLTELYNVPVCFSYFVLHTTHILTSSTVGL